jgi:hypothetical protein
MTLIVGALFGGVVFQVSDRRLTMSAPDCVDIWDPDSNKSLIVNLGASMLFVGYSGDAFVKLSDGRRWVRMPTDSWLAAVCGGVTLLDQMRLANTPNLEKVRPELVVQRVRADLSRYRATLTASERAVARLYIQIVGVSMDLDGRPRAIQHRLSISPEQPGGVDWTTTRTTSWWAAGPAGSAPHPALVFTPDLPLPIRRQVFPASVPTTIEAFRHGLVDCVQKVAERSPTVGGDVLALEYDPRANPKNVEVRHFPATHVRPTFSGRIGDTRVAAPGFRTPWYLSRYGSMEPRELTAWRTSLGTDELGEDPVGLDVIGSGTGGLPIVLGARSLGRRAYRP